MKITNEKIVRLNKSETVWRELLKKDRYRILFEEGTEYAVSSSLLQEKRKGPYICAAC